MKRVLAILAAVVAVAFAVIAFVMRAPNLAPYEAHQVASADSGAAPGLRVKFLGVSTMLFDDGDSAIMTDGFFTRPSLLSVATRIRPDSARIMHALDRAGVRQLAVVIPVHSHYDHAMDAPYVAKWKGAKLVGSTSTANVGRGGGLPDDRIIVAKPGESIPFGRFSVTLLESRHVPTGRFLMPGEITAPLTPPARTKDYRLGTVYSVVIRHGGRTIVVHGSAGFIPGAMDSITADVVYLSVATLGKQTPAYRDSLWTHVVTATHAKRVIAIHWDDFTRPLSRTLRPLPRLMDDFDTTMRWLLSHSENGGPDIQIAKAFVNTDPFAGLQPPDTR